ncbi:serine/threonine-protein kinase Nek8-like isoform X4 [Petromyzon marinus]|uniref:serine/threonine-protein kinase Nek8-like isoform X4 n=1 Tax=Petromyzon marinus TaxID=7757 RepID=UPI003F728FF4
MDKYEKIKVVGRGAFGIVHLCLRRDESKQVILKQIPVEQMSRDERQAAQNECQVLKLLSHPNVIKYFENFLADKALMIAMEYAPGGTLAEYIQKRGGSLLDEDTILHFFVQIALALHHVHSNHILHRDLKTHNILLDKRQTVVKIGDFGISKILSSKSKAYTVVGTPCYISPELCEGKPYNQKSDIWALGCILYELASLKRAFEAENLPALVLKIMSGNFAPVSDRYSGELRQLVVSLLNLDPSKRPQLSEDGKADDAAVAGRTGQGEASVSPPLPAVRGRSAGREHRQGRGCPPAALLRLHVGQRDAGARQAGHAQHGGAAGGGGAHAEGRRHAQRQAHRLGGLSGHGGRRCPPRLGWQRPAPARVALPGGPVRGHHSARLLRRPLHRMPHRGILMTYGSGSSGCLGHGSYSDVAQPKIVEALLGYEITQMSCGMSHVLAVSNEQEVFAWGRGDNGRLGLGNQELHLCPQPVAVPPPYEPCTAHCGIDCSMILTFSGKLLACGSNRYELGSKSHFSTTAPLWYNKLGLDKISHDGDDAACPAEQTEESLVLSPVQSSPLDGARVVHVALGTAHSAAVTDTGTCYTFGSNQHGQLGGGARTSSRAPQPVDGLGGVKVVQVTCGDAFTVAVAEGIRTGRCVPYSPGIRTCEISAWCPVEKATAPRRPVLAGAENFTVFIKNTIRFPKFDFSKRNVLERAEADYLKRCRYSATAAPYCPIFRLGQLVRAAGEDFHSLAVEGGVIGVQIEWSCNLDRPASECHPVDSFNRLDAARPHLNASSSGYNFRFAKYYRQADGGEQRKLFKVYGIRFDVLVFGKAGRFSIVPTAVNVGSGLALLGAGAFFCDLVLLYLSKRSPFYREKKYEEARFQRGESVQMGMKRDSVTIATII